MLQQRMMTKMFMMLRAHSLSSTTIALDMKHLMPTSTQRVQTPLTRGHTCIETSGGLKAESLLASSEREWFDPL